MTKDKKYNNTLYIPAIDSFKWRIELDKVEILNRNLLDHIINLKTNATTGEVIEEVPIQSNSLKVQFNKYHIHFAINKIFGEEYLVVLVNSKLLEHDYLEGIRMTNIEPIYKRIMDCQVFHISFEDFLQHGKVSDIDIKKDVEVKKDDFKQIISITERNSKPFKKRHHGVNAFKTSSNLGIEWNTREKGTYNHPFLKIYHKGVEALCSKNHEFFAEHIDVAAIENRVRIECTIKTFREAQKHGFKDNSLLTLLKSTTDDLNRIIEHSVTSNLEPRIERTERRSSGNMTTSETLMFIHLSNMIKNQHMTIDSAIDFTLDHFEDRKVRSRVKKQLMEVYQAHINGQEYEKKAKRYNSFFDVLGWK